VVEHDADEWVRHSREESDANVNAARDRTDKKQAGTGQGKESNAAVVEARELEDEALQDERAFADESLRREREEVARALKTLLPLERSKTDRNLLIERARSDDALSNRDDFMGIASHDLRNLLGGIAMSVRNIARRVTSNEEGKKILVETNRIERFTARMNRLIGDLVDVTRINAGKLRVVPEQADAAKLIAEAVEMFEAPALAKGITLKAEMTQQYIPAQFDYDRMLQVLANLITNAITFSFKGGSIRVRGELAGDEVLVSVSDTGCGIRDDMLTAVFERFWQVDQNDQKGLGLGLYISRYIVEAHGGRIWAESTVGEGSTFSFTIPCTADKERVETS
ncbi:MAG: HAMP domain-containing sensor histidine kinase, partial [Rhodothermales bacterium]